MKSLDTKILTISIPSKFYQALETLAAEEDRSKNYLVRKSIENYLRSTPTFKNSSELFVKTKQVRSVKKSNKK
jgi:predicted DNA-binding protein